MNEMKNDTLCGNEFISRSIVAVDPFSGGLLSNYYQRTCQNCLYRFDPGKEHSGPANKDCYDGSAKRAFDKTNEPLPMQIDGKEVGNYCSQWLQKHGAE